MAPAAEGVACQMKMKVAGSSICGIVMACHSARSCRRNRSMLDTARLRVPTSKGERDLAAA